jgi:hypothetical protein
MKSIFTLFALAGPALGAVSFSLPGNSEFASWALSSTNHPGFNTFRTAANPWTSTVSPDAGSASAVLGKVSGSGYIGSAFLYTAAVTGVFSIQDSSPLANLATVIFQGRISDPLDSVVLNYNGGNQALAAGFSLVVPGSPYPERAWQWDLSGVPGITSYEIIYSGHYAATSLAVTAGNSFAQVIPEPSSALLGLTALTLTLIRRRV